MQKRGVSAVVATVLIVLITVSAITFIWTAIIPMIKNVPSNDLTLDLSIDPSAGYSFWDGFTNISCIQIKRGTDNANIMGIQIIFFWKGSSETITLNSSYVPGMNRARTVCFNLTEKGKPDSVDIAAIMSNTITPALGSVDLISGTYTPDLGNTLNFPNGTIAGCAPGSIDYACSDNNDCTNDSRICEPDRTWGTCVFSTNLTMVGRPCSSGTGTCSIDGLCISNPSCTYGLWKDVGCGLSQGGTTCRIGQMLQNRTILSGTSCTQTIQCASSQTCDLIANAVSYWDFENDMNDKLGRNNCTAFNGASIQNGVLDLSGSNYLDCGYSDSLNITAKFSIVAWFYPKSNAQDQIVIGRNIFNITYNPIAGPGRADFLVLINPGSVVRLSSDITPNAWQHVAGVFSNSSYLENSDFIKFYRNTISSGGLASMYERTIVSSVATLQIGRRNGGGNYFNGSIDEVIIFNRSLSSSEIDLLYNYGLTRHS